MEDERLTEFVGTWMALVAVSLCGFPMVLPRPFQVNSTLCLFSRSVVVLIRVLGPGALGQAPVHDPKTPHALFDP